MNIGRYDQKIKFVTDGQVVDDYGGYTPSEVDILTTFAAIEQTQEARSFSQARTMQQSEFGFPATYVVSVMYRQSFIPTKDMRVVWRDVKYNITTSPEVNNVRMQKEWTFVISAMQ